MSRVLSALVLLLLSPAILAERFEFSYVFASGSSIEGVVNGTLQEDNNTVLIDSIGEIRLGGQLLPPIDSSEFRAPGPGDTPHLSLNGSSLELLVCPEGFTASLPDGGGDCPFTTEPGFVFSTAALDSYFAGNANVISVGDGITHPPKS